MLRFRPSLRGTAWARVILKDVMDVVRVITWCISPGILLVLLIEGYVVLDSVFQSEWCCCNGDRAVCRMSHFRAGIVGKRFVAMVLRTAGRESQRRNWLIGKRLPGRDSSLLTTSRRLRASAFEEGSVLRAIQWERTVGTCSWVVMALLHDKLGVRNGTRGRHSTRNVRNMGPVYTVRPRIVRA